MGWRPCEDWRSWRQPHPWQTMNAEQTHDEDKCPHACQEVGCKQCFAQGCSMTTQRATHVAAATISVLHKGQLLSAARMRAEQAWQAQQWLHGLNQMLAGASRQTAQTPSSPSCNTCHQLEKAEWPQQVNISPDWQFQPGHVRLHDGGALGMSECRLKLHALCFIHLHEKRDGLAICQNQRKDLGQPATKLAMSSDWQTTPDRPTPTPPHLEHLMILSIRSN